MDRERWIWTSWIIPVKSTLPLPPLQMVVFIKMLGLKAEKRGKKD